MTTRISCPARPHPTPAAVSGCLNPRINGEVELQRLTGPRPVNHGGWVRTPSRHLLSQVSEFKVAPQRESWLFETRCRYIRVRSTAASLPRTVSKNHDPRHCRPQWTFELRNLSIMSSSIIELMICSCRHSAHISSGRRPSPWNMGLCDNFYSYSVSPSSRILRVSVLRPQPSSRAASFL